jgi:aspartate oxidase
MSYTYSWEIKSELDPRDFITWELEEELEDEEEDIFIPVSDFDEDEVL